MKYVHELSYMNTFKNENTPKLYELLKEKLSLAIYNLDIIIKIKEEIHS
jgi:hypothetical protein